MNSALFNDLWLGASIVVLIMGGLAYASQAFPVVERPAKKSIAAILVGYAACLSLIGHGAVTWTDSDLGRAMVITLIWTVFLLLPKRSGGTEPTATDDVTTRYAEDSYRPKNTV